MVKKDVMVNTPISSLKYVFVSHVMCQLLYEQFIFAAFKIKHDYIYAQEKNSMVQFLKLIIVKKSQRYFDLLSKLITTIYSLE